MALYSYESPEPGDLCFTEGDTILVSQREGEWWRGSVADRSGLFPSNYVKPKEADVMWSMKFYKIYYNLCFFFSVVLTKNFFFFM